MIEIGNIHGSNVSNSSYCDVEKIYIGCSLGICGHHLHCVVHICMIVLSGAKRAGSCCKRCMLSAGHRARELFIATCDMITLGPI